MEKKNYSKYGWVIVALFVFGTFTYQYLQYQMSIVAGDIIGTFGIAEAQFSSLFTSPMIPAIFFSIIFGTIVDRFGMKWVIAAMMLVAAIGGIGHVYASSYGALYVTVLITGFGATIINVTSGKMFSSWLRPEMVSIGMGCFLSASTVGQFVAQSTTAFLGSLSTVFWVSGILCVLVFVAWLILGKENKDINMANQESAGIGETLKATFTSKNMWFCAIGLFFVLGCQVACNTWLPTALMNKGMSQATAGVVSSIMSFGNLFGSLLSPMIAAKIGKDKPLIIAYTIVCAVGFAFGWRLSGAACYIVFWISGFCASGLMPFFFSMPIKFKEIGPKYAGTATGFASTVELLGAVVLGTYVILPLSQSAQGIDYTRYFLIIGVCWLIATVCAILIPETGMKAKKPQ